MRNRIVAMKVLFASSALALAFAACTGAADTEASAEPELPGGSITLWSDSTELFLEHPALIVGEGGTFAVHLTDLTDFAPLRSGRITLRFQPRDGSEPLVMAQDSPRAPGIYGPRPVFQRPGVYDLTIEIESSQAHDVLSVPDMTVYASAADVPRAAEEGEESISFLKEQQWKTTGFGTTEAGTGEIAESLPVTGEILPAAGRQAHVAAPVSGLIEAGEPAALLAPGLPVTRGSVLAWLTPTLADAGGSAYVAARRELREAEAEYQRAQRLFAVQATSQRRVGEAEIRLEAARAALAGMPAGAEAGDGRVALRAPIGGVIVSRNLVPGSRVDAGQTLFTIVDPSVVWLRADVPAAQAPRIAAGSVADFRVAGSDRSFTTRRMISSGAVIDSISRTVPVLYEVANAGGAIPIGAIATVAVRTGARVRGVIIPASAILDEDGRPIACVQVSGESFQMRSLVVAGEENGRVIVLSGIEPGERVVTGAAFQVRLASMSTAVPAHGHEH